MRTAIAIGREQIVPGRDDQPQVVPSSSGSMAYTNGDEEMVIMSAIFISLRIRTAC